MAERRMFSRSLVESDNFLSMSKNARLLYFYLNLEADDDDFISTVIKTTSLADLNKSEDEEALKDLIDKGFLLRFDSGIILIKHWRQQNQISPSRHKDTLFQEELNQVCLNEKTKTYEFLNKSEFSSELFRQNVGKMSENCRQNVAQYRLDKISREEDSVEENSLVETSVDESRLYDEAFRNYPF